MELEFQKYIPFTKVVESDPANGGRHTVYGLVTAEVEDKEGEICDYGESVKAYKSWSDSFYKATANSGAEPSRGNVRVQHTMTVGGKVVEVVYDDDNKAIYVKSEPTDAMWRDIKRGFYTGYSQGGRYAYRKCQSCGTSIPKAGDFQCTRCNKHVKTRYAPRVSEVSYVDNPCLEEAVFTYVKRDGSSEMRKFFRKPITNLDNPDAGDFTIKGGVIVGVRTLPSFDEDDTIRRIELAADKADKALSPFSAPAFAFNPLNPLEIGYEGEEWESGLAAANKRGAEANKKSNQAYELKTPVSHAQAASAHNNAANTYQALGRRTQDTLCQTHCMVLTQAHRMRAATHTLAATSVPPKLPKDRIIPLAYQDALSAATTCYNLMKAGHDALCTVEEPFVELEETVSEADEELEEVTKKYNPDEPRDARGRWTGGGGGGTQSFGDREAARDLLDRMLADKEKEEAAEKPTKYTPQQLETQRGFLNQWTGGGKKLINNAMGNFWYAGTNRKRSSIMRPADLKGLTAAGLIQPEGRSYRYIGGKPSPLPKSKKVKP